MSLFQFVFSKVFLKQLALAGALVLILVFGLLWWLRITTNHNDHITVPDLKGMTLTLVEQELEQANLRYTIIDSANYNPKYPKFSVIDQSPVSGQAVKENRKIYLVLNPSGYPEIQVPNVVGKTKRQAEPTLKAVGFKIGEVTYVPHMAKDEVQEIRYNGKKITAGSKLQQTTTIDLVLGDGKRSFLSNDESDSPSNKEGDGDTQ